jgi:diguanylate cyclase (GGDEF)-like protein
VNEIPDSEPGAAEDEQAKAAHNLTRLQAQTQEVRAELSRLREEVVLAEHLLGKSRAKQLVEANEQLVLAALKAQTRISEYEAGLNLAARSGVLDALTELPNRVLLLDRFAAAIASAKRHDTRLALLFLDMDNFKDINDTLGHTVGDAVLKLAAQRIASSVRETDTVSRHGGDEFLILLNELTDVSDAVRIADSVIATLAAPCRLGNHVLRLRASIGISIYPDDGEEAQLLIDRADAAMYRAKRHGLGRFVFHHQSPNDETSAQSSGPGALQRPLTLYEASLAEHEQQYAQLRDANQHLVLAALNAQELQAASERAQRRQTEFLAVVAHELRTPLTPIRIAATMMDHKNKDKSTLPRMQAIIEQQVIHMSRLVSDLLDVSRVNTGKFRLEREMVDMSGVIDRAIGACRPAMDTRLQHLGICVPARSLLVNGDPVRLAQILINLLDNASKYTPQGGEIELSAWVEDTALMVSVKDSGIGVTAEALPNVFEPFVQDAHAAGFNRDGLGIGLTVVRELVTAHGGSVVASSAGSGQGSRFVVTLPLTVEEPEKL